MANLFKTMIPFIVGKYTALSKRLSVANCINMEVIRHTGDGAKSDKEVRRTPGGKLFFDLETLYPELEDTWCRGEYVSGQGILFQVWGTNLFKITIDDLGATQVELISSAISGSTVADVDFAESLYYLILVDSVRMYSYKYSTGDFEVVDYPDDAQPKQVAWIGGRMVAINSGVNDAQRNQVFYSAPGDDGVIDWNIVDGGGNFAASQSADAITSIQVSNGYLWVFGARSYEIRQPTGILTSPFALVDSTVNAIGCEADLGTTEIADVIFWVGSASAGSMQIFMSNGLSAKSISDPAIEGQLAQFYSQGISTKDVKVYSYSQAGQLRVIFNFIKANVTWQFNFTTGYWSQLSSYDPSTTELDRWEYLHTVEFQNHIITTAPDGKIIELDINTYSDYDEAYTDNERPLVAEYTGPALWSNLNKFCIFEFMLDIETGLGSVVSTDSSYNPRIVVTKSRDGGYTFGNGKMYSIAGKRNHSISIKKWGLSREHVIRIRSDAKVPLSIIGGRVTSAESVGV